MLKKQDFKIAIYVDDIGMAASGVSLDRMDEALNLAIRIIDYGDLEINDKKTVKATPFSSNTEYLGLKMGRRRVSIGNTTQAKFQGLREACKKDGVTQNMKRSLKGLRSYKKYVEHINSVHK